MIDTLKGINKHCEKLVYILPLQKVRDNVQYKISLKQVDYIKYSEKTRHILESESDRDNDPRFSRAER